MLASRPLITTTVYIQQQMKQKQISKGQGRFASHNQSHQWKMKQWDSIAEEALLKETSEMIKGNSSNSRAASAETAATEANHTHLHCSFNHRQLLHLFHPHFYIHRG